MKPSTKTIQAEIKSLREMKPRVHRHTAFGDDNHAAIEVQIRVLEKGLDAGDIYDQWDMDGHLCVNALYAQEWLDYGGETPSEGWSTLVQD